MKEFCILKELKVIGEKFSQVILIFRQSFKQSDWNTEITSFHIVRIVYHSLRQGVILFSMNYVNDILKQ